MLKINTLIGLVIGLKTSAAMAAAVMSILNSNLREDCDLSIEYHDAPTVNREEIVPSSGKEYTLNFPEGRVKNIILVCGNNRESCNKKPLSLKTHPQIPMIQLHLDNKNPKCTFINEADYH